jgi:hypothetical protein
MVRRALAHRGRPRHPIGALGPALALVLAAAGPADAASHHVFDPVPRESMRDLSADRPDLTESPYSVDAGHFQVEMDAYLFSRDDLDLVRSDASGAGVVNLKAGLLDNLDLQFVFVSWVQERTTFKPTGGDTSVSGTGDVALRAKINVWGQKPDQFGAVGLLPFVIFPVASNDLGVAETVYGLAVPIGLAMPQDLNAGFMVRGARSSGDETEWLFTGTLGRTLVGALGGFVEFARHRALEGGDWTSLINSGLTYGIGPDLQLDGGAAFGLTESAADYTVFLGLTARR